MVRIDYNIWKHSKRRRRKGQNLFMGHHQASKARTGQNSKFTGTLMVEIEWTFFIETTTASKTVIVVLNAHINMLGQRILDSISAPLYVSPVHQCSPLKYFANVFGRRHVRYQSHRGFFAVLPVQHWHPLLFFRYRAQDTSAKFDTVLRSHVSVVITLSVSAF